ncbi:MAG: hypothetical protein DBY05_01480 [Clostridiales bacterium]|nr:MAG: hypothetical protein DBY05_01480 [Clostridiales bacterium]
MFSGLLYCADCGNHLTIQRVARNRKKGQFCLRYLSQEEKGGRSHRILVSDLERVVQCDLHKVYEYVILHEKEFVDEYLSGSKKETEKFQARAKAELKRLSDRQDENGRIIRKLYEDNVTAELQTSDLIFL